MRLEEQERIVEELNGELFQPRPDLDALGYIQAIYRGEEVFDPRRFRAACAALPFEKPKLQAVATFNTDNGFAERLERAVGASRSATRVISAQPNGKTAPGPTPEAVSDDHMKRGFAPLRRKL